VILECTKRLWVPIENCLVVRDTEADILAARSAGAVSVAVSTGEGDYELLERERPGFLFRNLIDLDLFLKDY
jgi:beta-phosphoglucomutase-like phosphatase (HAD superfamily)